MKLALQILGILVMLLLLTLVTLRLKNQDNDGFIREPRCVSYGKLGLMHFLTLNGLL